MVIVFDQLIQRVSDQNKMNTALDLGITATEPLPKSMLAIKGHKDIYKHNENLSSLSKDSNPINLNSSLKSLYILHKFIIYFLCQIHKNEFNVLIFNFIINCSM